jgi:hypothetical protein
MTVHQLHRILSIKSDEMRGLHTITWKTGCNLFKITAQNLQEDTDCCSILLAWPWPRFKQVIWKIKV